MSLGLRKRGEGKPSGDDDGVQAERRDVGPWYEWHSLGTRRRSMRPLLRDTFEGVFIPEMLPGSAFCRSVEEETEVARQRASDKSR